MCKLNEPCDEKTFLCYMPTTKTQISLPIAEQAGLSLKWLQTSEDRFCHDAAQVKVSHVMRKAVLGGV